MLTLLLACTAPSAEDGKTNDTSEPTDSTLTVDTEGEDADGDGFPAEDDCDDADAEVYPGAPADGQGDGVDQDCDGFDGVPFIGCSPIDVPDVYATIEDALLAVDVDICLGPGTFAPTEPPEDVRTPNAFRGQGRDVTFVTDPMAFYPVGVLEGLTATGALGGEKSFNWQDVTLQDGIVEVPQSLSCTRCAFVDAPIEMSNDGSVASLWLQDNWVTGADVGILVKTSGCATSSACNGIFMDVRTSNCTFNGNGSAFKFDLSGTIDIYYVVENSIFLENERSVLEVDGSSSGLHEGGNGNIAWGSGDGDFPDGHAFTVQEEDPMLDVSYAPPRPFPDSPAIDRGGSDATTTDFWSLPRKIADRGAVEGG